MPVATSATVDLHYETRGSGAAVLLIMGLGMTSDGWWRTLPVLARSFRAIAFDNRGVGRSERPPGPYTVSQMADDALAVLDAAGEERAHVYGISLGGMVAQELALRHPERVRALVLGATTAGGRLAPRADPDTVAFFKRSVHMPTDEAVWAAVPYSYARTTDEAAVRRIGEDIVVRLRHPVDRSAYGRQVAAGLAHDTVGRLSAIEAPTLVIHGAEDRVVPPENGRLLAGAIPGAQLRLLPAAGHIFMTDDPDANRLVARWLRAQTTDGGHPAARARNALERLGRTATRR